MYLIGHRRLGSRRPDAVALPPSMMDRSPLLRR